MACDILSATNANLISATLSNFTHYKFKTNNPDPKKKLINKQCKYLFFFQYNTFPQFTDLFTLTRRANYNNCE